MARFNSSFVGTRTVNPAGGEAYKESPQLELVSILLTSFVQDQFYRKANDTIDRITQLLGIVDPLFAARVAVFARNKYGMRSISHVVAGEIGKRVKNEQWTKRFFTAVVHRVDDIAEIMSYYLKSYKKPIPNSMKKGLALSFNKFDGYQIAKYRLEGKELSLRKIVKLVHPKPTRENMDALAKLVHGELKSTGTWETKLTQAGQKAGNEEEKLELKEKAWTELVESGKIGYFALLRNLRNILEAAPEIVDKACAMLTDRNLIKKSLVLPMRYFTAIKEVEKVPDARKVVSAINKAAEISLDNVPKLSGKVLIVLDVSGSMTTGSVGGVSIAKIGGMFASILYKVNDAQMLLFDEVARFVTLNPDDTLLSLTKSLNYRGWRTDFNCIFTGLTQKYDRIIILSDMQGWVSDSYGNSNPRFAFSDYKRRTGADPIVYSFDLAGYGTLEFPERNVYCLAGFSDKVFDIMKLLENDRNALVHEIEKVEI